MISACRRCSPVAILMLDVRYPVAIEQAYAATRYVADNGGGLGIDPLRLAVAGDSVGGNMAAAVTLMATLPISSLRTGRG
jgi:acetyl esterase/lipase